MKKTIQLTLLLITLMSFSSYKALAYDIAVENEDKVTIYYNYSSDGKELSVTSRANYSYSGTVVIPAEVTYKSRTLKVTSIGEYAFYFCDGLTSITIGNSVTSIGNDAFYNCSGLTSITIGNSVTSIGDYAFQSCSSLTSITIPNSVTSIGDYAFSGCSGLYSVIIGEGVTSIGARAFGNCDGITELTIGNSVTSIGDSAFSGCSGLTSVTIPNSVITIGGSAFYNCANMRELTIGTSVTSIGTKAFENCYNLNLITSLIENPFDIYGKASSNRSFSQNSFNGATLYVPTGSIDKYKNTIGWKDFSNIKGTGGGETGDGKCAKPTISYANKKLTFSCVTDGVEFVSEINDYDIGSFTGSTIYLSATYNISVYATKNGMEDSDVATATLVWMEAQFTTDESLGVKPMQAMPVLIQAENGEVSVQGVPEGTQVSVYDVNGRELGSNLSRGSNTKISTQMGTGSVAVVKIGGRAVKVLMK